MCYTTTVARKTQNVKPLGATDGCPLVVETADLARFLRRHLEKGGNGKLLYEKLATQIKTCKEHGQILTGVAFNTIKRIDREEVVCTADNCAEAILLSQGASDYLGKDIPLYRNPFLPEWQYIDYMRKRLRKNWNEELDGPWDEQEQMSYIRSFPSITPS